MWLQLNRAYDRLTEPRRFLTFFIPTGILIVMAWVGVEIGTLEGGMLGLGSCSS